MKTKGLTLVEAIRSGKRFKRAIWNSFGKMREDGLVEFSSAQSTRLIMVEILATDYELELPKVTIDREMLEAAWNKATDATGLCHSEDSPAFKVVCKELGL